VIISIPHFPVIVTSKDNRSGYAVLVTDYGPESHKIWTVVLDDTGEVWDIPNPQLRFKWNFNYILRLIPGINVF